MSKTKTGGAAVATAVENPPFSKFSEAVHARFAEMSKGELYVTEGEDLFDVYLAAFPKGTNPMFRERTEFDCNCCKQFIRRLGHLVAIKDNEYVTVWGDLNLPHPYKQVADTLDRAVRAAMIKTVFRTKEKKYGVAHNFDAKTGQKFEHFHGEVAKKHYSPTPDTPRGAIDTTFQVAKRGLLEFKEEHLDAVLDLIDSNGLYKGAEYRQSVVDFQKFLKGFKEAGSTNLYIWANLDNPKARLRSSVLGTLFTDLAEGKDFEQAVKAFETKNAPQNYKRPTAIITQRMLEEAQQKITDLGLGAAIYRRLLKLSDVSLNDVLWADNEAKSQMKDGIASLLANSVKKSAPDETKATSIDAGEFLSAILPKAKSLEVYVANRHAGNFVSLTTGDDPAKLFQWDNPAAWSYDGDVTDSVKQRVKAAGGNISAKLRVSLSWFNTDDLDLFARLPGGEHIYYGNKMGILDVDMNVGNPVRNAVENLAFNNAKLKDGIYTIGVHQFRQRESEDVGFSLEVEFGGVIQQFSYQKIARGLIHCLTLTVKNGALVKTEVAPGLVGGTASQEKWGVMTESLVPVAAVLNSPNHWGDSKVGAKHVIFALKGCKNPEPVRGIYNEFLRSDLHPHRKVFEVLGAKTKCKPSDEQVSGVGFTAARNDSVTVVVDGRRSYILSF